MKWTMPLWTSLFGRCVLYYFRPFFYFLLFGRNFRPCLDLFFSLFIIHHSISVTRHSSLITHHLKYPTCLVFVFPSHHSNISTVCGTHCRSTMSMSIVSLPASLNSFHFIFFSFNHHCPVTLPTQTQTQVR